MPPLSQVPLNEITASSPETDFWPYPMVRFPELHQIVRTQYVREATVDGIDLYRRALGAGAIRE